MAFLRTKKVNGKTYYYLVKSERIDGKVRQKVLKYIGSFDKLSKLVTGSVNEHGVVEPVSADASLQELSKLVAKEGIGDEGV